MKVSLLGFAQSPQTQINNIKNKKDSVCSTKTESFCRFDKPMNRPAQYFHPSFCANIQETTAAKELIARLTSLKSLDGSDICSNDVLKIIKGTLNPFNIEPLNIMARAKTKDGNPLYNGIWMSYVAENTKTKMEREVFRHLIKQRVSPDTIIGMYDIALLLRKSGEVFGLKGQALNELCHQIGGGKGDRFGSLGINNIVENVKNEQDFTNLKIMLQDKELPVFDIIKGLKEGKIATKTTPIVAVERKAHNPVTNEIKEFKVNTAAEEISREVAKGDVVKVGDKLFVNDDGELIELKLTKEKFAELFNQTEGFCLKQGVKSSDCWLISALDNIMDNSLARAKFYRLFRQDGNDIYIKFPKANQEIKFSDSKTRIIENGLKGPLGLQMFEQAYSVHRFGDYSNDLVEDISKIPDMCMQMEKLSKGTAWEVYREIFSGSEPVNSSGVTLYNKKIFFNTISECANDEKYLLNFSTNTRFNDSVTMINPNYNLYVEHEYSINGYDKETGMVSITNPYDCRVITKIPIYELLRSIKRITIAQLKS